MHALAPDIGEVIITTLASPAVGVALVIQKIAQKAREELGLPEEEAAQEDLGAVL